MKISANSNYTKRQLVIEEQILNILNDSSSEDGLLLSNIKDGLINNIPGFKTSYLTVKGILDDLVAASLVEVANPGNTTWQRFRLNNEAWHNMTV